MDTRLLHPWDFLGKSTRVGCHFLLQGIFLTQGSNPGLPLCRQTLYHLSHQGRRPRFNSCVRKIRWRRDRLPTPVFLGFPRGSAGKESACNAGDLGSIPGLGKSPGKGEGYQLQYSGLENSMDCSLPSSSVHGIFQAIVLEWIAISFSRGSSQPRDQTQVSRIVDRRFTV